jgi:hypothetical protein
MVMAEVLANLGLEVHTIIDVDMILVEDAIVRF